jgi:hypothetical protein
MWLPRAHVRCRCMCSPQWQLHTSLQHARGAPSGHCVLLWRLRARCCCCGHVPWLPGDSLQAAAHLRACRLAIAQRCMLPCRPAGQYHSQYGGPKGDFGVLWRWCRLPLTGSEGPRPGYASQVVHIIT